MAKNYTDCFIITLAFNTTSSEAVPESMKFQIGNVKLLQKLLVVIAICSWFSWLGFISQNVIIIADKREVAMISFFASIFYAVNAKISLVRLGYITNGIN